MRAESQKVRDKPRIERMLELSAKMAPLHKVNPWARKMLDPEEGYLYVRSSGTLCITGLKR